MTVEEAFPPILVKTPEGTDPILAIDPGTDKSGWCAFDPLAHRVLGSGVLENPAMMAMIREAHGRHIAIEMIASYGMPVGREVFETCVWIGRFMQVSATPSLVERVFRKDVKVHLCGSAKAKDGNVRQAILDAFPRSGGGATPQIGTKGAPGPLYGVSTHAWPALGVALTSRITRAWQAHQRERAHG